MICRAKPCLTASCLTKQLDIVMDNISGWPYRYGNLNYLEEQAAQKSAADVSLDLRNQITEERVATEELERKITLLKD